MPFRMDAFTGLGRIEVWKVTKPAVYRAPSTEGQVQIFVRGGTVGSVDMGFQAKTDDGFGLVRALWRNVGAGDHHVFVLTHPADVLYSVDLKNHTAQPLAMPTTAVGNQPPVAMLGEGWAGHHGPSQHVSLGFVYSLSKAEGLANDEIDSLFICDSDADGVPDNFLPISREIFESLGLEDATQWTHNKW
ncbi:MAG: hypothetical protein R3E96_02785 [Planctomycetota bacterium]